ncbi:MAG: 1-(5-phosphoribosyl)-5-[(5-phosphoribosylamino)methylideneamino]imidazole-4-carboxamide isomerase [Syntrophomonadaceae bacterium]|jgi:phosphoribosylformimino-5-aminoimidazole carboxamide ribotide isomerase|nr:1-(5-phosphoribosyl)-5-[(5-phosphoribosylamino)methylideneamino]imidazole-4-carboxamide isomerase [Syntrophomonadaceae bacterium]
MIIFPAIDLQDGHCVRLVQGQAEAKTVYSDSPRQIAASFEKQGARYLHVVDLDGAFTGSPQNAAAIEAIAESINIPFQVGGGLRSVEDVKRVLQRGAARAIVGTRAVKSPGFVKELLDCFGTQRIVLGIDAREGMVAVEGWVETSNLSALEFGHSMKSLGVSTCVFTDINRDGLLTGPNLESTRQIAKETGLNTIASGGVSTVQNIRDLKAIESCGVVGAIIGKALYDGKIDLLQALKAAEE